MFARRLLVVTVFVVACEALALGPACVRHVVPERPHLSLICCARSSAYYIYDQLSWQVDERLGECPKVSASAAGIGRVVVGVLVVQLVARLCELLP